MLPLSGVMVEIFHIGAGPNVQFSKKRNRVRVNDGGHIIKPNTFVVGLVDKSWY
jgi:hypothetical protein